MILNFFTGNIYRFNKIDLYQNKIIPNEELENIDNFKLMYQDVILVSLGALNFIPLDMMNDFDFANLLNGIDYLYDDRAFSTYLDLKSGLFIDLSSLKPYNSNIQKDPTKTLR